VPLAADDDAAVQLIAQRFLQQHFTDKPASLRGALMEMYFAPLLLPQASGQSVVSVNSASMLLLATVELLCVLSVTIGHDFAAVSIQ
jgi:hypothetical protein